MDAAPPPYSEIDTNPQARPTLSDRDYAPQSARQSTHNGPSRAPTFVSGSPYFAMRPAPTRRPNKVTAAVVTILPGTRRRDVTMPKLVQKSRGGIDTEDWEAFVNHMLADQHERTHVQTRSEKSGTISSRGPPNRHDEIIDINSTHLRQVVTEWNVGFFIPRGISLILQTEMPEHPAARVEIPRDGSKLGEALYEAVKKGDVPTIKLLLSYGADPNYRPSCSTPSLVRAVKKENEEIVRLLLERGADVEVRAPAAESALFVAVKSENHNLVRMLLLYNADVNSAHASGGEPCLYRSVKTGHVEITKLLLDQNPNLEKTPPGGSTALYLAAKDGNISLVSLLLQAGAKPECHAPGGCSALYRATEKNNLVLSKLLLDAGADVNFMPYGHNSALSEAVKREDREMVQLLLAYGADIHKKSSGNKSALTYATKNGLNDLLRFMLEAEGHPKGHS